MKWKTIVMTMVILWSIFGCCAIAFGTTPDIVIDGKTVFFDVRPQIEEGRLLVPLRGIFEMLGAEVVYEAPTRTIRATRDGDEIVLQIGSSIATINGSTVMLEVPARIVQSRTLVPLRFVSEALGAEVFWNETDWEVLITSRESAPQGVPQDYTDGAGIHRVFRWNFEGKEELTEIVVNQSRYRYYGGLRRVPSDDYSIYVTHPADDGDMKALVVQFRKIAEGRGYSERTLVDYVIRFVQSMEYALDVDANGIDEYPQYPLETLVEKGGDCEDTTILLAALLKTMGYETLIIHYPGIHTGVGLWMAGTDGALRYEYNGRIYTFIETTTPYPIGMIPPEFEGLSPTFFTLVPKPAVRFIWESTVTEIEVRVNNEGTGAAERLTVRVVFESRDGKKYNRVESPMYFVGAGDAQTITLTILAPDVDYRYLVGIYNNGTLMAEDRSRWFDIGSY